MKKDPQQKLEMNRTGKSASPLLSKAMLNETEDLTLPHCPPGNQEAIAKNRIVMIEDSKGLGSVPIPLTPKGAIKTGMQLLEGSDPKALIDKLGERLGFESTGVRIYEALISKFQVNEDELSSIASLQRLQEIRDEEQQHLLILKEVIEDLGADPTALTPSADITGIASMGIVKVLSDPRINFIQSLDAILVTELNDNECWNFLIELTTQAGLSDISEKFKECYKEEQEHLSTIRDWVKQFGLGQGRKVQQEVA